MTIGLNESGDYEYVITLDKSFDFNCVEDFRKVYEKTSNPKRIMIDFRNTSFIDSSALGMLINMRKYWKGSGPEIKLINCGDYINKILTISRLDKLFVIE